MRDILNIAKPQHSVVLLDMQPSEESFVNLFQC